MTDNGLFSRQLSARLLLTLTTLMGIVLAALTSISSTDWAQADGPNQAGLVVVHGDGSVVTRCVDFSEDDISGLELLERSGLDLNLDASSGQGMTVCRVDNEGCTYPQQACFCQCQGGGTCTFWSYWHLKNNQWQFSGAGASVYRVSHREVDGWLWGSGTAGGAEPPTIITFEEICGAAQAPTATSTSTATSTPTKTPTPTDTAVPPTKTFTPSPTPPPTLTPTTPPTDTPLPPTNTPIPISTNTPDAPSANTSPTTTPLPSGQTPTAETPTPSATETSTPQGVAAAIPTATASPTHSMQDESVPIAQAAQATPTTPQEISTPAPNADEDHRSIWIKLIFWGSFAVCGTTTAAIIAGGITWWIARQRRRYELYEDEYLEYD